MKVLFIPSYFGGISWWRFETPAAALRAAGVEVTVPSHQELSEIYQSGNFRSWLANQTRSHDLLHVGYSGEPEFTKALFEARDASGIAVITDIDDDIESVPTYNVGWRTYGPAKTGQRAVKIQLQYSDAISLSTDPLAESLAKYNPKHQVLHNWVDVDSWDYPTPPERAADASVRIMVTGGRARYGDWSIIKEPLEAILEKYKGKVRLFFLGATPDWVLPYMADKKDPKANACFYLHPTHDILLFNRMVRHVAPDIVLSPVQCNLFNRSKSGLKFLEASLAGAAFLCTDFDTYSIAPQGTCLKVDNTFTQWTESLSALIEDGALRRQLAEKARDYVLDCCQAKDHIKERTDFYTSVLEGKTICQPSPQVVRAQEATSAQGKS